MGRGGGGLLIKHFVCLGDLAGTRIGWVAGGGVPSPNGDGDGDNNEKQGTYVRTYPGQPTPATHPGKQYAVRKPLTPMMYVRKMSKDSMHGERGCTGR